MNASSWTWLLRLYFIALEKVDLGIQTLPPALKRILRPSATHITVRIVQGGFTAVLVPSGLQRNSEVHWQEEAGHWQPEATLRQFARVARERPVDLELPLEFTLSHSVRLPRAALTNLADAIAYGLPTWSPFQANDVYIDGSVERIDGAQAVVRLHYALRSKLDPLLMKLDAAGLAADRLVLDSASRRFVALPTPKLARLRQTWLINGALASSAIILALLLCVFQIMILSGRLEETESAIRSELVQLRQEETLKAAYASFSARRTAVSERRAKEISANELLASLARHLPNDIFVQALELGGGQGRIGLSGGDPDVILQVLRGISIIHNPQIESMLAPPSISVTFKFVRKGS
ncbi:hypothetical protein [Microvirga sp. 2TAF3]|uniref:hypothetical protein n=1 Tax=Microvirga sp. 2TAF3 TaxID=3233014 RepID=UPI003F9E7A1E